MLLNGNVKKKKPMGIPRTKAYDKFFDFLPSDFSSRINRLSGRCWEWTGRRDRGGYGLYRGKRAHRFMYELNYGPIGDGRLVCHRCDNPRCVSPAHLFLGTALDNHADMKSKTRGQNQAQNLLEAALMVRRRLVSAGEI